MAPFVVGLVLLSAVMHASWNLVARRYRANDFFLRILVVTAILGLPPAIFLEFTAQPVFPLVWTIVSVSAVFQGIYFWGVSGGYRSGDFTVVYPLSRALPVLFIAFVDMVRGHVRSACGCTGFLLV